jgi:hypothetical protein
MASWLKKWLRGTVVGLMLLLAAAANLVSFSYDADDDDDTPPITVELSLSAPVRKAAHLVRQQSSTHTIRVKDEARAARQTAPSVAERVRHLHTATSPQVVTPLRT